MLLLPLPRRPPAADRWAAWLYCG